jgi:hypothetical protein
MHERSIPFPRSAASWLGDEDRFGAAFAVVLAVLAALKGLRQPGAWCFTQSLAGYSQGFVKRGLLGTLYGAAGIFDQRGLTISYFVELATLATLLIWFTRASGIVRRLDTWAVVWLFAGSYAVTFLFHLVGYSDLLNAALLIALLLVRKARLRFWVSLPGLVAGLLIHEGFLLLFCPVLLLTFYVEGLAQPAQRAKTWRYGLVLTAVAVTVMLLISLAPRLSPEKMDALANMLWDRADFVLREDYFQALTNSLSDNLRMMRTLGYSHYQWWLYQAVSVFVLGPALVLLLRFSLRLAAQAGEPRLGGWTRAAVLLAVLSPLTMHLLGLDQVRWNVWTVVDAYLVLGVLAMHLPGEQLKVSAAERNALLLAVALGMASGYGLFNSAQVNPYPFFPRLVQSWIAGHDGQVVGF